MKMTKSGWWSHVVLTCLLAAAMVLFVHSCEERMMPVHAAMQMAGDAVAQSLVTAGVDVHYAPAENLEALDMALLDEAAKTVDISTYAMDDRPIAEELVKLANRGVKIRIYRDQIQYQGETARGAKGLQDLNTLFQGQKNIQVRVKGVVALAHLKAYVIDNQELREGSANWSASGLKVQDNSLIRIRDPTSVAAFERNFEVIWNRPSNQVVQ